MAGHKSDPNKAAKDAGIVDYDFLDKDVDDGYPAGTKFDLGDEKVDVARLPDPFVKGSKPKA